MTIISPAPNTLLPALDDAPLDRALRIMAAEASRHTGPVGDAIRWCMRTLAAEIEHCAGSPISDAEQLAAYRRVNTLIAEAPVDDDPAFAAWAAYTAAFQSDSRGHLRCSLKAAILARRGVPAVDAVDAARDGFDQQVHEAGDEADRLIEQARRIALAAEMGEVRA